MVTNVQYTRLNKNADSLEEVSLYYQERARQLLYSGFIWTKDIEEISLYSFPIAARTTFLRGNKTYVSYYVYSSARERGYYKRITKKDKDSSIFLTVDDCNLESFFKNNDYNFVVAKTCPQKSIKCYDAITKYYGNRQAKRSGVSYMNHIDEGVYILKKINANDDAISAYMIHPIFQGDFDLELAGKHMLTKLPPIPVAYALEYRNIANAYLSPRAISSISEIKLSPIKQVNQMLIADKIQNYKDFCYYHMASHPRANELHEYFCNWFERLDVTINFVNQTIDEIRKVEKYEN